MRTILTIAVSLALALALTASLAGTACAEGSVVHVVQRGENLFRIALRYGVTANSLAAANGLSNASRIYVGQRLVIPTGGESSSPSPSEGSEASLSGVHVVQRGENLFRIALRYGLTSGALAAANGIANPSRIYAGQRLVIPGRGNAPATPAQPAPASQSYTVRRGDTLSAIARRYGISTWTLAQTNGIRNPSFIYVGQVLRIPQDGSSVVPAPAPASPAPTSGRWIDVNLSAQQLTAYEGNTPVRSTLVSTGLARTPTLTGQYRIHVKYASTLMSGPGYYLPNVPYAMYYDRGYSIHGTYWHSNFGHPMSHGCINLPTPEAQWLFNWASVGTLVNIHY
jgi:LysM repeat protein